MLPWDRKVQGLLLLLAAALIFAGGFKYARWQGVRSPAGTVIDEKTGEGENPGGTEHPQGELIGVHVAGAVGKPGVYYFPQGTRVVAAVEKAEPLAEADLDSLNLARILVDGEKIYVPRPGETPPSLQVGGDNSGSPLSPPQSKLNLNTATAADLDARLPGIGPVLAQRIVDYRNSHGPFRSIEDLQNVSGIGPSRFEQIKELVTI
ncbi:MAG: ComEA family DNA-binding protein [Bacillota bacterium]|jgi:competence protein ComEA|nr:ComEA family DNA-binding protein [Bacillota bacterium]